MCIKYRRVVRCETSEVQSASWIYQEIDGESKYRGLPGCEGTVIQDQVAKGPEEICDACKQARESAPEPFHQQIFEIHEQERALHHATKQESNLERLSKAREKMRDSAATGNVKVEAAGEPFDQQNQQINEQKALHKRTVFVDRLTDAIEKKLGKQ